MKRLVWPILILGFVSNSIAQEIDANEVLRRWEKAFLAAVGDCAYECEIKSVHDGRESTEQQTVILRDDGSSDVTAHRWKQFADDDAKAKRDPADRYHVRWLYVVGLKPYDVFTIMTQSRAIEAQASSDPQARPPRSAHFGGYEICSQTPSPTYLLKQGNARLRDARDALNGVDCYVIDAKTEFGTHTLWIDPDHGWNIARSVGRCAEGDRVWNGFTKLPHAYPDRRTGGKQPALVAQDRIHEFNSFLQVGDIWMVERTQARHVEHFADGTTRESVSESRRWNVDLKPDLDKLGAFKIDLPNGTSVFTGPQQDIKYEWRDGTVKPVAK